VGGKAMAWKKRIKTSDKSRAREIKEKEKERENSKLNIKLHFAIGSSRRKREDPTEIPRSSQKGRARKNLIFLTLSFSQCAKLLQI